MSRRIASLLIGALALMLLVSAGCRPATVKVETGERVTCVYGHLVSENVKVIEVPAADADKYGVVNRTVTCDRHKALEKLYADAQAAIAKGDFKGAREMLAAILKDDPNFPKAAEQAKAIDTGKKPSADTTGTAGGNTGGGKQPVGPVANLTGWVPDKLAGYSAQPVIADELQVTREYLATGSGNLESLVIVVEQYKTTTAAKQAITTRIKRDYPVSPSSASAKGRTLYFGTDGRRFALVAWNEGGLLVAIEGSARDRKPAGLKAALTAVANAIIK